MSILLMAHTFDCNLTAAQKSVLLVMANFANDEGENVFPSQATIAKKTSLTRRGVVNVIQQLTDLDYVKIVGKKSGRQNIYCLNVDKIVPAVHPVHISCAPSAHNPLIESLDSNNKDIKELKIPDVEPGAQVKADQYAMMQALATTCGRVLADNRAILGRFAKKLIALHYTPDDVTAFGSYWFKFDWRGKQKQAPYPAQVLEFIGLSKSKQVNDGYLGTNLDHWKAEAKKLHGDDSENISGM